MADNSTQNGTDTIATDEVTTLNGAASSGVKVQRVKSGFGAENDYKDVSAIQPLPVVVSNEAAALYRGRASTFRTVGRAGTTARRIVALWNAAGSGRWVQINQIAVDIMQTAVVAVTVIAPPIRVYRITAIPTGGTALTKVPKDTALSSAAGISLFQDASAEGTNSATPLAANVTAGASLTNEFSSRLITAAGFEMMDRAELLSDKQTLIRPGEGIVLSLDITLATQEPAGTHTLATLDWAEFAV